MNSQTESSAETTPEKYGCVFLLKYISKTGAWSSLMNHFKNQLVEMSVGMLVILMSLRNLYAVLKSPLKIKKKILCHKLQMKLKSHLSFKNVGGRVGVRRRHFILD